MASRQAVLSGNSSLIGTFSGITFFYWTLCHCFIGPVTFSEFTKHIVDIWSSGKRLNRHWRPQNEICNPCFIKYDFIGRFETLVEDAKHVFAKITASRRPQLKATFTFPFKNPSHKTAPLSQMRHNYYVNLSRDIVRNLIHIYKIDYELFGYDYRWACSDC